MSVHTNVHIPTCFWELSYNLGDILILTEVQMSSVRSCMWFCTHPAWPCWSQSKDHILGWIMSTILAQTLWKNETILEGAGSTLICRFAWIIQIQKMERSKTNKDWWCHQFCCSHSFNSQWHLSRWCTDTLFLNIMQSWRAEWPVCSQTRCNAEIAQTSHWVAVIDPLQLTWPTRALVGLQLSFIQPFLVYHFGEIRNGAKSLILSVSCVWDITHMHVLVYLFPQQDPRFG